MDFLIIMYRDRRWMVKTCKYSCRWSIEPQIKKSLDIATSFVFTLYFVVLFSSYVHVVEQGYSDFKFTAVFQN